MARTTGTVKWFSQEKGYGFIQQDGGPDVFVHHTAIQGSGFRTLDQGERVEFDVIEEPKGPKAQHVVRLAEAQGGAGQRPAGRAFGGLAGGPAASAAAGSADVAYACASPRGPEACCPGPCSCSQGSSPQWHRVTRADDGPPRSAKSGQSWVLSAGPSVPAKAAAVAAGVARPIGTARARGAAPGPFLGHTDGP